MHPVQATAGASAPVSATPTPTPEALDQTGAPSIAETVSAPAPVTTAQAAQDAALEAVAPEAEAVQAESAQAESAQAESAQAESAPQAPRSAELPAAFVALGLAGDLVAAVRDLGYTEPTPVQARTIPLAMPADDQAGVRDLMVCSQTGSGKTAAFLLPALHILLQSQERARLAQQNEWDERVRQAAERGEPAPKRPRRRNPADPRNWSAPHPGALVLCPTRELAQQVAHDAIDLVRYCAGLRVATIVGGMPYQAQIARLQNANLVVATPGRLLDLQRSGQIGLDQVEALVVDEADRMLDLGFADDLAEIHQLTASRRATQMFSATFAPRIQQLAMRVMHEGGAHVQRVEIDSPQDRHTHIRQSLYWADDAGHKRALLDHWLRDAGIDQAIVFASTQIECDELATDLQQAGFHAVALHGALSQGLRNRRLMALRSGQVQILVATDVAARGIDVPTITHVFNYGLPMKAEDYTHRIGRTGRAGREGLAVTIAQAHDVRRLRAIAAYTHQRFQVARIEGLEPRLSEPDLHEPPARGRFSDRRGGGRFNDRRGGADSYRPRAAEGRFKPDARPATDERKPWAAPRSGAAGERPAAFERSGPSERGAYNDRAGFNERPSFNERGSYGDRAGFKPRGGQGEAGGFDQRGGGFNDRSAGFKERGAWAERGDSKARAGAPDRAAWDPRGGPSARRDAPGGAAPRFEARAGAERFEHAGPRSARPAPAGPRGQWAERADRADRTGAPSYKNRSAARRSK